MSRSCLTVRLTTCCPAVVAAAAGAAILVPGSN